MVMKHCFECLTDYLPKKKVLEGEIKDAKMSSFSSDFKIFIKHLRNYSEKTAFKKGHPLTGVK